MALNKRIKYLMDEKNMGNKELSNKSGVPLRLFLHSTQAPPSH